uniref:GCM domain-containing protein n=1 Tax=Steinernema glaseri TaxID=37863 RepID=A0A1I8AUJ1_9BILA
MPSSNSMRNELHWGCHGDPQVGCELHNRGYELQAPKHRFRRIGKRERHVTVGEHQKAKRSRCELKSNK